jgi:hypothetical protein
MSPKKRIQAVPMTFEVRPPPPLFLADFRSGSNREGAARNEHTLNMRRALLMIAWLAVFFIAWLAIVLASREGAVADEDQADMNVAHLSDEAETL